MTSSTYTAWSRICAAVILLSAFTLDRSQSHLWRVAIEAAAITAGLAGMLAYFRFHSGDADSVPVKSISNADQLMSSPKLPEKKERARRYFVDVETVDTPIKWVACVAWVDKGYENLAFGQRIELAASPSIRIYRDRSEFISDAIRVIEKLSEQEVSYEIEFRLNGPMIIRATPSKKSAKNQSCLLYTSGTRPRG